MLKCMPSLCLDDLQDNRERHTALIIKYFIKLLFTLNPVSVRDIEGSIEKDNSCELPVGVTLLIFFAASYIKQNA